MLATQARHRAQLAAERGLEAEAVRRSDTMKTAVLPAVSHHTVPTENPEHLNRELRDFLT